MLFNSQVFILVFLPLVLAVYFLAPNARSRQWAIIVLSFGFYGYADLRFLPLLAFSIVVNWGLAHALTTRDRGDAAWLGIAVNLGLLGYFKYRDFFLDNINALLHQPYEHQTLILPIGISFFTFQQISYLVDLRAGRAPLYDFRHYCFYVSYFPQLIAGPIVRHNELIPQLDAAPDRTRLAEHMGRGAVMFIIGLSKKVLFADRFAEHVNAVYAAANHGAVATLDAWTGTLSFAFQIYFDFSAYSDMAIGLALIMGLHLPINFNAPYRSASVREFWRRWHMTFSRFLRDYLYIPMGGNRHGMTRQLSATMTTMGLCGLWHGAGWNFVLWGLWHGVGISVNVLWGKLDRPVPRLAAWPLTLLFVLLGWVLFRAQTFDAAMTVYQAMVGFAANAAPAAHGFKAQLAGLAGILVLFAPPSQRLALDLLAPSRWVAAAASVVLVFVVLEVGKGQPVEFIYFEF
jgi:D-alanyl-lipoteichoic acid acyltransferase DltB (MBOAT superfamily)